MGAGVSTHRVEDWHAQQVELHNCARIPTSFPLKYGDLCIVPRITRHGGYNVLGVILMALRETMNFKSLEDIFVPVDEALGIPRPPNYTTRVTSRKRVIYHDHHSNFGSNATLNCHNSKRIYLPSDYDPNRGVLHNINILGRSGAETPYKEFADLHVRDQFSPHLHGESGFRDGLPVSRRTSLDTNDDDDLNHVNTRMTAPSVEESMQQDVNDESDDEIIFEGEHPSDGTYVFKYVEEVKPSVEELNQQMELNNKERRSLVMEFPPELDRPSSAPLENVEVQQNSSLGSNQSLVGSDSGFDSDRLGIQQAGPSDLSINSLPYRPSSVSSDHTIQTPESVSVQFSMSTGQHRPPVPTTNWDEIDTEDLLNHTDDLSNVVVTQEDEDNLYADSPAPIKQEPVATKVVDDIIYID